jgi:hydroxyethylthiazole kinase-like sugar kinase family protein
MTTTQTRLPQARHIVIVSDGSERWVGNKREIYGWLAARNHARGFDCSTNLPNSVKMDASEYEDFCNEVTYRGKFDHLTHGDVALLEERGAVTLHIA